MVLMWTNLSSWHPPVKDLSNAYPQFTSGESDLVLVPNSTAEKFWAAPVPLVRQTKPTICHATAPWCSSGAVLHPDGSHHLGVGPVALPGVEHEPSCAYWQGCTFQLLRQFHPLACSGDFSSTHPVPHFQKWQCRSPVCCPSVVCVWVRVETG